jgi:predicted DCC family thiol-disulfide oxidoreductase YuxK
MKHLVFYDAPCPLCNRAIRWLMRVDRQRDFYFAPLAGETAQAWMSKRMLSSLPEQTLVFVEYINTPQEAMYIRGKGVMRILWRLGGVYALLGCLNCAPAFLLDPFYRWVARYRYQICSIEPPLPVDDPRFLP